MTVSADDGLDLACRDLRHHDGGPITSAGRFSPLDPLGISLIT
jgi:hypothetical protein